MSATTLTIGRLAHAADIGVETIRYYQKRGLLPIPNNTNGAFRHYPIELISRIKFIKRAQELGFTLNEISELLELEDGKNRDSIRQIATHRLQQIESKLTDLQRMHTVLSHLVTTCEHTNSKKPCPIINTLLT